MVEHDEGVDQIAVDKIRTARERVMQRAAHFVRRHDNALYALHADAGVVDAVEGPAAKQREQVHYFRVQLRARHCDVGEFRCRRRHQPRYDVTFTPLLGRTLARVYGSRVDEPETTRNYGDGR